LPDHLVAENVLKPIRLGITEFERRLSVANHTEAG
jgi:hypothetical protein